jgi:hypothetical protein
VKLSRNGRETTLMQNRNGRETTVKQLGVIPQIRGVSIPKSVSSPNQYVNIYQY